MRDYFDKWYNWITHYRLASMKKAATTVKSHIDNIVTYAKHRITNALGESVNAKIEKPSAWLAGSVTANTTKRLYISIAAAWICTHDQKRTFLYDGHLLKHNMLGAPMRKLDAH
jgi:hypothetical protein